MNEGGMYRALTRSGYCMPHGQLSVVTMHEWMAELVPDGCYLDVNPTTSHRIWQFTLAIQRSPKFPATADAH